MPAKPKKRLAVIGNPESPHVIERVERFKKQQDLHVQLFNGSAPELTKPANRIEKGLHKLPKMDTLFWLYRRYKALKKFEPDLLFIMYADPYTLFLSSFLRIPVVVSAWGGDLLKDQGTLETPMLRRMSRRGLKKAKAIFSVSEHLKQSILEFMGQSSIPEPEVLFYGIDLNKYQYIPPEKVKPKEKNDRIITFFSPRWALPLYNTKGVIKGFNVLCNLEKPIILLYRDCDLTGSDLSKEYAFELKKELEKAGCSKKAAGLGLLNEAERLATYKKSDVVVSLSLSDGTPLSVLEAMAMGKIVICHNIPSLKALIDHGKTGFLVDGNNEKEVTELFCKIVDEYDSISETIGAQAREFVEKHANLEREVGVYLNLFRKLAAGEA